MRRRSASAASSQEKSRTARARPARPAHARLRRAQDAGGHRLAVGVRERADRVAAARVPQHPLGETGVVGGLDLRPHLGAVVGGDDAMTGLAEQRPQRADHRRVVIDDEDRQLWLA